MDDKIHKLTVDNEFKVCPLCGYKDGFHSSFKKQQGVTRWLFVCPSCHAVFDIGHTVTRGME